MIKIQVLGKTLGSRSATKDDCKLIYQWRNLPDIVALSSTQKEVSWQEHTNWFKSALISENISINIITLDDVPIGIVRYDLASSASADISIYLIKEYTGRGLGVITIEESCKKFFLSHQKLKEVTAHIQVENDRSQKAFEKAGFIKDKQGCSKKNHLRMIIRR